MTELHAISPDPMPNTQDLHPPGATGYAFPLRPLLLTTPPLTTPLRPPHLPKPLTIHTTIILTPSPHTSPRHITIRTSLTPPFHLTALAPFILTPLPIHPHPHSFLHA